MDTLVTVGELASNLDNPDWVVVDCRFSLADPAAGRKAYNTGHIPDAHYISLDDHLSTPHIPGKTGRHPLPDIADWRQVAGALGIQPGRQVVMYDDAGGAMAARMWWMLRWIGHEQAAVLDGGWQAWQAAGQPESTESPGAVAVSAYPVKPALVTTVSADELDTATQQLVDARDLPRYRGDTESLDPVAGHIPGAACSPFSANLDASKKFLSPAALKEKFAPVLASGKPVVCYCGSGVTAAHNILAMKITGLDTPPLYPGSWSEWITDPSRPVATGDEQ
jgi:thiosulfate/3-mercaptopyruvate sulfurtransferase